MIGRQKSGGTRKSARQEGSSGGNPVTPAELSLSLVEHAPLFIALCDTNFSPVFLNRAGREMAGLAGNADIGTSELRDFFVPESYSIIEETVLPDLARVGRWTGELQVQDVSDPSRSRTVRASFFCLYGARRELIGGVSIATDMPGLSEDGVDWLLLSSMDAEHLAGQRGLHGGRQAGGEDYLYVTNEKAARPKRTGATPASAAEPDEAAATATVQDAENLRRTAKKLKLNEAKLREATELVALAVYSWDPVLDAIECDDRLRAIWGLPSGEAVDREVLVAGVHPGDRARVDAAIAASLDPSGDGRYDIEYRVVGRDDGVERWVSTSAQVTFEDGIATGLIGAAVDISEKRRAEAAVSASEARFRAFAQYSANILWIIDPASKLIDYRSPAYERIWGEPIEDAPKGLDNWLARIHPDDLQSVRAALETVKAGELTLHEYRIIRADGSVRWLRETSFPIWGETGKVALVGGIVEDLTLYDGNHIYVLGRTVGESGRLTNLLRSAGFQVRSFDSASALIDIAPVLTPGCVLVDLRTKLRDAMQIPRELKARSVLLPTVFIGPEVADPESIVAAMKAGAADYLIPPLEDDALKSALASAMAEMHGLGRIDSTASECATRVARLTSREREVLQGLVNGGTNKTIAKELGISPRTVELYRSQAMARLEASSLPELIQIAIAAGLRPRQT